MKFPANSLAHLTLAFAISLSAVSGTVDADESAASPSKPLNVLLITSGCCHDYDFQSKSLQLAAEKAGVKAAWTVVSQGGKGTHAEIDFYDNADWAKGFDVVVHNECFAATTSPE
ncbi:hypothetical protein [Aporhodopirellula aestuarii]|uniref:ThuA-like domain-containing protein n=1 Tax=Aporhodopirellula aestuarii TaxID=2950107 RepID=A0ABT0U9V8_9BACT|nr:hypothetical protein [Aporhodopirellula aestuarii]MCM2373774.1 hypothetical protein [Aporhodopirellula aestuarii]